MIAIGCDFVGVALKGEIMKLLEHDGLVYKDFGAYTTENCDYPVYAYKVCKAIQDGECDRGILICGTGVGMSLAANKMKSIRCVCCSDPYSAGMGRAHNNANVIAIGARVVGNEMAKVIIKEWLYTEFLGNQHAHRVDMVMHLEKYQSL